MIRANSMLNMQAVSRAYLPDLVMFVATFRRPTQMLMHIRPAP
jgi:hypothetical protein